MRLTLAAVLTGFVLWTNAFPQSGGHVLFGDIKVDETQAKAPSMGTFVVLLYSEAGGLLMRQTVPSNGRYRFLDLRNGRYEVVVEFENREIARILVSVNSPYKTDFRQDIELKWTPNLSVTKASVISVADYYSRSEANKLLFREAKDATGKKQYDKAISLLRQIVDVDDKDFGAWQELGTNFFIMKSFFEADSCYFKALQLRPHYVAAMVGLGRVRIVEKNLTGAIEVLERAVKAEPTSPQANYFLGDALLQAKIGSRAVEYLNAALQLDPIGMADAHLLLAALYNATGMKDKAAAEYQAFLKVVPNYPDRKKLQAFISANKPAN
jgi:tetratricopeptide (TPR) repeat protein